MKKSDLESICSKTKGKGSLAFKSTAALATRGISLCNCQHNGLHTPFTHVRVQARSACADL